MADISSADGTKPLLSNNLKILTRRFKQNYTSRRNPHMNQMNWKLWDNTIKRCRVQASLGLWIEPLGEWKTKNGRQWRYHYSPSTDRVFALHGQVWIEYIRIHQTRKSRTLTGHFIQKGFLTDKLPGDSSRADVFRIDYTKIRMCGFDKGKPVSDQILSRIDGKITYMTMKNGFWRK